MIAGRVRERQGGAAIEKCGPWMLRVWARHFHMLAWRGCGHSVWESLR